MSGKKLEPLDLARHETLSAQLHASDLEGALVLERRNAVLARFQAWGADVAARYGLAIPVSVAPDGTVTGAPSPPPAVDPAPDTPPGLGAALP